MEAQNIKASNLSHVVIGGGAESVIEHLNQHPDVIRVQATQEHCLEQGYAPRGYGLADFSLIRWQGRFHLFHIPRVPGNAAIHRGNEHWIGHAVSDDLNTWVACNPAICIEPLNYFESAHVWAPFVHVEGEDAYMYYTGLSDEPSQVLCIAKAQDAQLDQWKRYEHNPIIPLEGFDWHYQTQFGHVRHARDPHVVKVGERYLMAYTAMHREGCPAVGGMISDDLLHWEDIGPILFRSMDPATWLPESVNIQPLSDGRWVMIPSQSPGLEYYISDDPLRWHDAKATPIHYVDGDDNQPMAIEVLSKNGAGHWLVCFFERDNNRLFVGRLDTTVPTWTLKRVRCSQELSDWY